MITIRQAPPTLAPAYNDANYVFTSTNVGQPNFKFVVDLYVGGVKVDRMFVPPHPTHLSGLANVAPLLESRISKDIAFADNRILNNSNSYLTYTLKAGEAYGSSGTTIYPDLAQATGKYIWNGIYDFEDYIGYSSGTIVANGSSPVNFLTNAPSSGTIEMDDNAWLYWCDLNLQSSYAYIVTRASDLSTLNTFKIDNKFTTTEFLRIVSGPANLNTIPNAQFTLGAQPILTGVEHSYSIQIFDATNREITKRYFYTLASNCSKYEKRRLIFFNKLGGYDTFTFNKLSKEKADIDRSNYKKNLGSYASANSFVYSKNDRANSQFHTKIKDKISLESDWITEEQATWLEELLTSPDVYLDDGTALIPINITNGSYEKKKTVNTKMFNLSIEYTLSYDRYRQRL